MENGFAFLLLVIMSALCLWALLIVLGVLFPTIVQNTRRAAEITPGRAFLIGFINTIFFLIVVTALGSLQVPVIQILTLLILVVLVLGITFGFAGMVPIIGARLVPDRDAMKQNFWGAAAMILACLTPIIGWFGLFPYLGFRGLGGLILSLFQRPRRIEGEETSSSE
ncbi:MAG: hypothetical protein GTO18_21830 [Anaerolineales bacterium]|nr:hypothetical protein [Anaerolineales bacterium]